MSLFYNTPTCAKGIYTVKDALDQLQAFDAAFEVSPHGSAGYSGLTDAEKANWRAQIREGVIHCGNGAVELDFFEKMFAGQSPSKLEATDLYTKYDCDRQYNIYAQDAATGASPGGAATFTLMRSNHAKDGKHSNAVVNGNIFIYEDNQWVRVTAIDTTVDYAHIVTVVPFSKDYTVNIRKGKAMMFNPVRFIDGYSCSIPSSTWDNPGYVKKWTPFRVRKDWEQPFKIDGPYHDIMQFHLVFNSDGTEADSFEAFNKTRAREELQAMKNLAFFVGQRITNPLLVGMFNDDPYLGFEGLVPMLKYGGGGIFDYDPAIGFDIEDDFSSIILQQDSQKRTKEFLLMGGINFMHGLRRRSNQIFSANAGACTFQTFVRGGATQSDIQILGVDSVRWGNYSIHTKQIDAWSDSRYLGHGDFPNMGIMVPGTGLTDTKGRSVPALEFFEVGSSRQPSQLTEVTRNHFALESGCEKLSGSLIESYMMAMHCPGQWVLLNPIMPAA